MTPIALIYFLLGLSALYWPFVTLFFKRHVLVAQWLIMAALMSMGLAVILYSTFFNSFLKGEYLLVIMFMVLSLFTPPLILSAVTNLTDTEQNRPKLTRLHMLGIPAVVLVALMSASVIIGGDDMYRLWIQRGSESIAHHFFAGSWRYNLIVVVHFYLYWFLIVAETTFVGIYSIIRINRFSRLLDDYYSVNRVNRADLLGTYLFVALNCFFVVFSYVMYPFNTPRPVVGTAFGAALQAVDMFFIGYCAFRTPVSVEVLNESRQRLIPHSRRDLRHLGRNLVEYMEREKAFLNPDLSVFLLADYFRVSEDDIIDAVHRQCGTSFSDYVESQRIEYALRLLNEQQQSYHTDNPDDMTRLAHQCGYLERSKFENSFQRIMQTSLKDYCQ
ncbi:MAG: helix-turn-helix domain-containing protein [Bacteroidales bacterium]|nr:helix-turn-helix domain-containing protein [Bacteroidales bacterium]